MGEVLRKLAEVSLGPRDGHNGRLFVDLSESVHIHYREHRLVFGVNEFRHFARVIAEGAARLDAEVTSGYRSKSDAECRDNVQVPTIIIGGSQTESLPWPRPERSKYFDERLVIEQQTERVKDRFHVHYRDLRIVFNDDRNFLAICDAFRDAGQAYRAITPVVEIRPRWDRAGVGALDHVDEGVPIVVDREGTIIDGHHRYYRALDQGADVLDTIRLAVDFEQSHPLRAFDLQLKRTQQWELLRLYKRVLAALCPSAPGSLGRPPKDRSSEPASLTSRFERPSQYLTA